MIIISILSLFLIAFVGYLIGRFGDYYLNFWLKDPSWAPHHWIYGLILMIIAIFLMKDGLALWIFAFGLGLFISDLEDFLDSKYIGSDNKSKSQRRFWHIN